MNATNECPLCGESLRPCADLRMRDVEALDCPNCGRYDLSRSLLAEIEKGKYSSHQRAVMSHAVNRMQRPDRPPLISVQTASDILRVTHLPPAQERIDNLVVALARDVEEPGHTIDLHANLIRASIGAIDHQSAAWVVKAAKELQWLEGQFVELYGGEPLQVMGATLSTQGWRRFDELQRTVRDSRRAFMAMKFGDDELTRVFSDVLRPAVKQTGFELQKLDDAPRAGLIDDRLRVEIRRAQFLIADLSHGNAGAYWEAGFAEGLGRPVIYTCRKDVFDGKATVAKPHFDTNHHLTIVWDPTNLPAAAEELKAVIRNTLPHLAKLEDDGA